MGETFYSKQNGCQDDGSQFSLKEIGSMGENGIEIDNIKLTMLLETVSVKPHHSITSDGGQLQIVEKHSRESFIPRRHGLDCRIPKNVSFISLNERYLQRCLDLVEDKGLDSVLLCSLEDPRKISMNPKSPRVKILFDSSEQRSNRRLTSDLCGLVIQCPPEAGLEKIVASTDRDWVVGTIHGKKTTNNILKSPLIHRFGSPDNNTSLERFGSLDVKEMKYSECTSSPSGPSVSFPQKLVRETSLFENQGHGSGPLHKKLISISSTDSTCSNELPSSASATISQGILQCIWKKGIPQFTFSIDDRKEVYVANMWKVESSDDKDLDYIYLFHSRTSSQKVHGSCYNAPDLVGKMQVSNSLSLCSNNSKLLETQFVLYQAKEKHLCETRSSVATVGKNKGTPKKVVDIFRTNNFFKHGSNHNVCGIGPIYEDFSWNPCEDTFDNLDALGRRNLLECSPCLELAAIVVKELLHENPQEEIVGGWGLKFLEKARNLPANTPLEQSVSSDIGQESCNRNRNDCSTTSTSMTVLIPDGIHGGPRTNHGGPSSLTERWQSGGKCDCGGWDIGCPLRVLNGKTSKQDSPHADDTQEECKPRDLVIEGGKQDLPAMRMMQIQDGSYIIHFHSKTISILQAFSIGVANIHTQNPTLYPKNAQKLRNKN